jgi:hypothetical protein
MQSVNINQRETLESYYPQDSFVHDANHNALARTPVIHGLSILSVPNAEGTFKITKAQHSIAEEGANQDVLVLYPLREDDNFWFDKSEPDAAKAVHVKEHPVDVPNLYRDFIDRVLEAARNAHFQTPIGRNEPRLYGFHGG